MIEPDAAKVRAERLAMGISHADFFRVFPTVIAPASWRREGLAIHVEWPAGVRLTATVSAQKQRRIASLSLPYVDIDFDFVGMAASAREAFLARFDRAFQKGGG